MPAFCVFVVYSMEFVPIYWAVYLFLFIVDFGLVGPPY